MIVGENSDYFVIKFGKEIFSMLYLLKLYQMLYILGCEFNYHFTPIYEAVLLCVSTYV
jgi:hypothetical protein